MGRGASPLSEQPIHVMAGEMTKGLVQLGSSLAERATPFVLQTAVSSMAYSAGLAATQGCAYALRISCATRLVAPVVGCFGVMAASAAAGQASAAMTRWRKDGRNPFELKRLPQVVFVEDLALDALLGTACFLAMGGRFRSVLPSDLRFVGALARESLPAAGSSYASDLQRAELKMLFRRYGCHHCGKRTGRVIADHQPPNKTVYGARPLGGTAAAVAAQAATVVAERSGPEASFFLRAFQPRLAKKQRFYPQCGDCSQARTQRTREQSAALRNGVKKLKAHFGGVQPFAYSGPLIGLRHYSAEVYPSKRRATPLSDVWK